MRAPARALCLGAAIGAGAGVAVGAGVAAERAAVPVSSLVGPAPVERPKIAVVLPLSGRFASAGKAVLDGVRAAFHARDASARAEVRLEVRDDGGEASRAVAAIEELARDPDVVAVVGPLLSPCADPAARRAEELGLPLVSISPSEDIGAAGPRVFGGAVVAAEQVDAVVAYASEARGLSRFAILYPATALGGEMAGLFRDRVIDRGGSVAAIAAYGTEETDLRKPVGRLLGTEARAGGAGEAARTLPHLPGVVPPQLDGGTRVLKPGMDFDAVFVPDTWKRVMLAGPALAYAGVDVGDSLGAKFPDVTLLSLAQAHHPDLVRRGGKHLVGTVLVDAFAPEDPGEAVEAFRAAFAAVTDREPTLLEALAWDGVRAVLDAIDGVGASREALPSGLARLERFGGATGLDGFDERRRARRRLVVLEATPDGFRKVGP